MSHQTRITAFKAAAVAIAFATITLFTPGCAPECEDKFDCAGKAKAGELWTCVSGVCKLGSPDPGTPDAGG